MPELNFPILVPIVAGAFTVFGMILATALVFSVDTPRVRPTRRARR